MTQSDKVSHENPINQANAYAAILNFFGHLHELDLEAYNQKTLQRRLSYRLTQLNLDPSAYLEHLKGSPQEQAHLYSYLFISDTSFFRDAAAFEALKTSVLKSLVNSDESKRIWVVGCSTGQEAYSLAISLLELCREAELAPKFKLFATDINEAALEVASQGEYPEEAIKNLPADLLKRYFEVKGDTYKVNENLRQLIVFAKQDLCKDPPFTKLDLISCRNVLIYFNKQIRQLILGRFHFCLKSDGYLFLGTSEDAELLKRHFNPVDIKYRLYQKQMLTQAFDTSLAKGLTLPSKRAPSKPKGTYRRINLLHQLVQPGFLLDKNLKLVECFGRVGNLLEFSEGKDVFDFGSLIAKPLAEPLSTSLLRTVERGQATNLLIPYNGQRLHFNIQEVKTEIDKHYFIAVRTLPSDIRTTKGIKDDTALNDLELALAQKEDELQTALKELELSNEKFIYLNEELLSSNERLKSLNEELHSVNEELHTVNAEYQNQLHAMTQANNDLLNLQNVAEIGTVFVDRHKRIRAFSPLVEKRFQFMPSDTGRPVEHLISNLNIQLNTFKKALNEALEDSQAYECEVMDHVGTPYYLRLMPYKNDLGKVEGAVISLTEISQLKQAQERLSENHRLAEHLIAATPGINYIYTFGVGRRSFAGSTFPKALGYPSRDERQDPTFLTRLMHPDDLRRLKDHNERLALSKEGEAVQFEFRLKHFKGHWVWLETRETVHKRAEDGAVLEVLGIALDISSRKHIEEKLQHDTLHDALTGLKNRVAFVEHLQQTHKDFLRYPDQTYAVLFIDLDRFKAINDSYGHAAGDHVLVEAAKRVSASIRNVDIVARHSGDEFLVLLKNVQTEQQAEKLAEKIIRNLEKDIVFEDLVLEVSASIGIAMANPNQDLPEFLINSADIAMYKSKKHDGRKVHIFDDSLHLETVKQTTMEHELRVALRENKLRVHYQPIVDLASQRIVALEALARWPHESGFIPPSTFIPLAESTQLIAKVDRLVFEQACAFIETLSDKDMVVNLNFSAKQLSNPGILEYLLEPCIDARRLCLEITESQLLLQNPKAVQTLEALSNIGYQIAIDDFGTGYSSLSYLQSLPAKTLKVDRSFIQGVKDNTKSREIIAAITQLAKALNYKVVAEGVETKAQLEFIKKTKCEMAQGFLFHKPMSSRDCQRVLTEQKKHRLN